jgi:hypothetical protein
MLTIKKYKDKIKKKIKKTIEVRGRKKKCMLSLLE